MKTGKEGVLDRYPTPEELWKLTFAKADIWRDRFAEVAFEDKGGFYQGRYYQDIAIGRVLEAIAGGKDRILLTLATGTGKTFIAFQSAWKLFYSRWNLSREPSRRPRILFLADRNILADQAYNAFSPFPEDALARIEPDEIRKRGRVPKNASLFFTIFQTFMSGTGSATLPIGAANSNAKDAIRENGVPGKPTPYFGEYPPDFFDFIVVDECHRGGANDESTWRGILEYFSPAVQLGLTATPKRQDNIDTYAYFGEPVFIYSLKEGINDGFLTPFIHNHDCRHQLRTASATAPPFPAAPFRMPRGRIPLWASLSKIPRFSAELPSSAEPACPSTLSSTISKEEKHWKTSWRGSPPSRGNQPLPLSKKQNSSCSRAPKCASLSTIALMSASGNFYLGTTAKRPATLDSPD